MAERRVEEGHDLDWHLLVGAVEFAQQRRRADPPANHVDAQRTVAGPDGGERPGLGSQQVTGVRQERLPVRGEPDPACGSG